MARLIEQAEQEVLAEIVRFVQMQNLKGARGGWKDFLASYDRQLGSDLSDPARRPKEVLIAFLKTFSKEFIRYFGKMVRRHNGRLYYKKHLTGLPGMSSEQQLVSSTLEHPDYLKNFTFPSFKEGWEVMRVGKFSEIIKSNALISLDCEMVECHDGSEAVVRVCAVDRNLEMKLDTLVKPMKPISDYRTHITGLSAKDLEGVECTLADVQKLLRKLLPKGTILIGHSLYNDLRALKLDYPLVIDTTCIFKLKNSPGLKPSLNSLCKSVLGFSIREEGQPHNCLRDAEAAMKLVLAKLEGSFEDPIMISRDVSVSEPDLGKLLVHRVPIDVPIKELVKIFPILPLLENQDNKGDLRVRGGLYSTYVNFNCPAKADEVFYQLEGQVAKDTSGRPQKYVNLIHGGKTVRLCVRKMTADDSGLPQVHNKMAVDVPEERSDSQKKRPQSLANGGSDDLPEVQDGASGVKRQRACVQQCDHVAEIERLKKQIEQREEEIFGLQKALAAADSGL